MALSDSTKAYISARKSKLSEKDLTISLLMDEVYCEQKVQYCGGQLYGKHNNEVTKTLLCVMVKSFAGNYMDIVSMNPINNINADKLYKIWMNVFLTEI